MAGQTRATTAVVGSLVGRGAAIVLIAGGVGLTLFGVLAWGGQASGGPAAARFAGLVVVPVLVVASFVYSTAVNPRLLLLSVVLLDIEAVLLGTIETGAPYFVVVPIIGVALATSQLPSNRLIAPYIAAWLAGIGGMFAFVSNSGPNPSLTDVAIFAVIDAALLILLWQIDSHRAKALEAVAEAESRFRGLLEGIELYAVAQDRDDRITFINPFALRMTGRTLEETLGRDWHDMFATPERREARRQHYRDVMEGLATQEPARESEIVTATGERRIVRWSHAMVHDAGGERAGLSSIGEDVTAARAAAEAARQASELMAALVVSSPLPSAILRLDRTVELWNAAAADLFGWGESEVLGRKLPEVVEHADRRLAMRCLMRAVRGHRMQGDAIQFRARDGRLIAGQMYAGALRDADGRTVAVAVQVVDVTVRQAMEEKLREAQRMEAVGRLAGGVAHDFNNSLTAIGGFAALIAASSESPRIREDAETIMTAVRRSATLTRALLAYSRRSLLQPETIDVSALIATVRPMLRQLLGEDVQIVVESDAAEAWVRVDPGQLEQALLNLAVNARDAMPEGGRLTIATRRIDAADEDGDEPPGEDDAGEAPASATDAAAGWVSLSVADTGVGIAPEHRAQVFEPFFTTKPIGAGTGLGLAMVQGFVLQSGGRVRLASEPGAGTTVEIVLPAATGPVRQASPAAEPLDLAGHGETVLFVEDEASVAAAGFQLLRRRGYRVLLADTGATAIALLNAHSEPIALLLLDVILPDMRGPQVAEAALASHPEAAVLYASGYSADTFVRRGDLDAGVDLVEKPYTAEQLAARIRSAIERHETDRASSVRSGAGVAGVAVAGRGPERREAAAG